MRENFKSLKHLIIKKGIRGKNNNIKMDREEEMPLAVIHDVLNIGEQDIQLMEETKLSELIEWIDSWMTDAVCKRVERDRDWNN